MTVYYFYYDENELGIIRALSIDQAFSVFRNIYGNTVDVRGVFTKGCLCSILNEKTKNSLLR